MHLGVGPGCLSLLAVALQGQAGPVCSVECQAVCGAVAAGAGAATVHPVYVSQHVQAAAGGAAKVRPALLTALYCCMLTALGLCTHAHIGYSRS